MTRPTDRPQRSVLAETPYLRLVDEDGWGFVERANARGVVAVVALTTDGELVLTEQYRPAVKQRVIDLPAGLVGDSPDDPDESLESAARRELLEETGCHAHTLTPLFTGPPSPGLSSEMVTFFLARDVQRIADGGGGDHHEDIQVHLVPLANAADWLNNQTTPHRCIDIKVYAGLYFAHHHPRTNHPAGN